MFMMRRSRATLTVQTICQHGRGYFRRRYLWTSYSIYEKPAEDTVHAVNISAGVLVPAENTIKSETQVQLGHYSKAQFYRVAPH